MVNYSAMWPLLSIYMDLTVFVRWKVQEYLVVGLWIKWVVTVLVDVVGIFRTYLPIKAAISLFMDTCDQEPLLLPKMQDPKSLRLHWRSFSRWGREGFPCFSSNTGGQYFLYDCIWPVAPPDYPSYMTNNHWCSVDAHFQDAVGSVCLFVLIMKVANTSKMDCDLPMSIFYDQQ